VLRYLSFLAIVLNLVHAVFLTASIMAFKPDDSKIVLRIMIAMLATMILNTYLISTTFR